MDASRHSDTLPQLSPSRTVQIVAEEYEKGGEEVPSTERTKFFSENKIAPETATVDEFDSV